MSIVDAELIRRIHSDLLDNYDEELELELDDRLYIQSPELAASLDTEEHKEYRQRYF
jgi:polyphosphate kinase